MIRNFCPTPVQIKYTVKEILRFFLKLRYLRMMERYPEWSDKYSVQILVAIGGGGWKDYFKLSEDHDTNGFLAKLTYPSNEHIYKVCFPT